MEKPQRYDIGLGITLDAERYAFHGSFTPGTYSLDLTVELRAGRYTATRVEMVAGGDGVTGELLRELAVGKLVEQAARHPEAEDVIRTVGRRTIEDAGGPTDAALEVVATAYRYGFAVSDTPTREVIKLTGLPRSKVSRWLATARERGLLGETREREAGGVVDEITRRREVVAGMEAMLNHARARVARFQALAEVAEAEAADPATEDPRSTEIRDGALLRARRAVDSASEDAHELEAMVDAFRDQLDELEGQS